MAERDLKALRGMADPNTFADEIAGFHAQQAVEKSLKARIAAQGEEYPHSHNIAALLVRLDELGSDVKDLWGLTMYNASAVQFRYEAVGSDEPPLDRQAAVADVEKLADSVRSIIQGMEPEA